jgi:hypothetical protein
MLHAWLLWVLSFGVLFSVPGSYGYSGFGELISVPGSYVVTLKPRGLRAEGAGRWGKLSQLRKHGLMAIVAFPDFP